MEWVSTIAIETPNRIHVELSEWLQAFLYTQKLIVLCKQSPRNAIIWKMTKYIREQKSHSFLHIPRNFYVVDEKRLTKI